MVFYTFQFPAISGMRIAILLPALIRQKTGTSDWSTLLVVQDEYEQDADRKPVMPKTSGSN